MDGHTGIQRSSPDVGMVSGSTFDGVPFTVALDGAGPFDHGSMARIYKGEHQSSQPLTVALKVFGQMLNPVHEEILVRELRVARQVSLTHDLILAFLGTADIGGRVAIVSLYMHNGNLMEYIKSYDDCDKNRLVAEAVNFLHTNNNLVHGDIKCANVLISDFGDALLADFGLSTFIEQNQDAWDDISPILEINPVPFAAPEILLDAQPKTPESDVYAFGMLILEVVTEKTPWHGLNSISIISKVDRGEHPPRPMNGRRDAMSGQAWELCRDCWHRDPAQRIRMYDALEILKTPGFDVDPMLFIDTRSFVTSVAYMPDGRHVVLGSGTSIRVWDTRTGRAVVGPMRGHSSYILSVVVSPNGLEIASSSPDNTIRRWNAASGTPVGGPIELDTVAHSIGYSTESHYLAFVEGTAVCIRHTGAADDAGGKLTGHTAPVNDIAFSPVGERMASGSADGTVIIWDVATRNILSILKPGETVDSIVFSPDGARLAVASAFQPLQIWTLIDGCLEATLSAHTTHPRVVLFDPAGNRIASLAAQTIRIWDARTRELMRAKIGGHTFTRTSASFSPDGRSLVFACMDEGIKVWDL